MIDIYKPKVFPQCETCHVAQLEIMRRSTVNPVAIKIDCYKVNLLVRRDITMRTTVSIVNRRPQGSIGLTSNKLFFNVVTDSCPGWQAEKSGK